MFDPSRNPAELAAILEPLAEREFALERRVLGKDFFDRTLRFSSVSELIERINRDDVLSVHVGPRRLADGRVEGEVRFDLDVTDYADVCSCPCAQTRTACAHCWAYIQFAAFFIAHFLEDVFQVPMSEQRWLFSGNRGVHCWVLSEWCTRQSDQTRAVILSRMLNSEAMHCAALCTVAKQFYEERVWPHHHEALQRRQMQPPESCTEHQAIEYLMPRIDQQVTRKAGHLLRCPFTRHQRTGRYSKPIPAKTPEDLLATSGPAAPFGAGAPIGAPAVK